MKESVIQRGVLDYLELFSRQNNIYFFRAGSGAMKTESGRFFKTGKAGCADIVACHNGKFYGLEVKTDTGRQSEAQKRAEDEIIRAGGEYHIVRSISDIKKVFPL